MSRGEPNWGSGSPAGSGAGSEPVEEEVSKGTPSPEVTCQPSGVISTNWPSGLARSRRIFSGVEVVAAEVDAVGDADVARPGIAGGEGCRGGGGRR